MPIQSTVLGWSHAPVRGPAVLTVPMARKVFYGAPEMRSPKHWLVSDGKSTESLLSVWPYYCAKVMVHGCCLLPNLALHTLYRCQKMAMTRHTSPTFGHQRSSLHKLHHDILRVQSSSLVATQLQSLKGSGYFLMVTIFYVGILWCMTNFCSCCSIPHPKSQASGEGYLSMQLMPQNCISIEPTYILHGVHACVHSI